MNRFFNGIGARMIAAMIGLGLVLSALGFWYVWERTHSRARANAAELGTDALVRAVRMFMVSTVKYHDDFQAAETQEDRVRATEEWNRSIIAVDEAVIHDFGEDKVRVRLIGDEEEVGYPPLAESGTGIEIPFETEAIRAIRRDGAERVERMDGGVLRIAVPLRANAHPGCAECHGMVVGGAPLDANDPRLLGTLNAYVPMAGLWADARSNIAETFLLLAAVVGALIALTGYGMNRMIVKPVRGISEAVSAVAEGDLTVEPPSGGRGEIGHLATNLKRTIETLRGMIGGIRRTSLQLTGSSEELAKSSECLSGAAVEQAAQVEETSASVDELAASIQRNASNAAGASEITGGVSREAAEGRLAVVGAVDAMRRISEKIGIVNDIADQTNLLALNAAIEAARVGEMGKGFAVVAVEVRKLAERSQLAAKEISELAKESVDKAENAGEFIERIVPAIEKTAGLVSQISEACGEQVRHSGQIREAVSQLDQVSQQNSATSEQLAASGGELASNAQALREMMARFRLGDGDGAHEPPPPAREPVMARRETDIGARNGGETNGNGIRGAENRELLSGEPWTGNGFGEPGDRW